MSGLFYAHRTEVKNYLLERSCANAGLNVYNNENKIISLRRLIERSARRAFRVIG